MKIRKLSLFIVFVLFIISGSHAQEVVGTSGDHFESSEMQISWTIGETVIETFTGADNTLTQGFHQGILSVTAIRTLPMSNVTIKAYPNPVTSYVNLSIDEEVLNGWSYSLYSSDGSLLFESEVEAKLSQISMQSYVASNYILRVVRNNQEMKAFKIVKTK